MTWYVVQTNPNNELKAVGELRRAGFRAYLPKAAKHFRHHRTKELGVKRRPALVGYVFMRFPDGYPNWYALRLCQGVKGVLYCDDRPYQLARTAVAAIMRSQRAMSFDTPNARTIRKARMAGNRNERIALAQDKFRPGMRVHNVANGIIAEVIRVTKRGTIEAVANIMGTQTPVEFTEIDAVETLDEVSEAA